MTPPEDDGRGWPPLPVGKASPILGTQWVREFDDISLEWRRIIGEVLGTFLLVLAAAGPAVVGAATHQQVGLAAAVTAPGLMVMVVILSIGTVSGAHLNPVVSLAFALRREFPWRRLPGYVAAQLVGGVAAGVFLRFVLGDVGSLGATVPAAGVTDVGALVIEAVLTLGLVTTILGTASGAQNVGPLSAIAVGGYIALAGIWAAPASGASMNPARSLAPELVAPDFAHWWVYVVGPLVGALAAVGIAFVLRGPGGDATAARAAQGTLSDFIRTQREVERREGDEGGTG
ncbi:MAG: aquaporin [Actinomycetota bacterium]|nr:aquaporin [Actinomycetota bacterium]